MMTSLCAKGLAALVQIYAIYVVTSAHSEEDAALIFLLSGYAIWLQLSELGVSQTLQNKFNTRQIVVQDMLRVVINHYFLLTLIGLFVIATPFLSNFLLPGSRGAVDTFAFSVGSAILILSGSNVVVQRFLLIMNKGILGNYLLIIQSLTSIIFLYAYQFSNLSNILLAVTAYFGPQILIFFPFMVFLFLRYRNKNFNKNNISLIKFSFDSLGYCGAGFLSAIFLGADYFFAAYYLNDRDVVTYYFVTRIFFISFIIYYSYLIYRVKNLSNKYLIYHDSLIISIVKDCVTIGMLSVILAFFGALILNRFGLLKIFVKQDHIDNILLIFGFIYFSVRVFRDVCAVLMSNLNKKYMLYKLYLVEIFSAIIFMPLLIPLFDGVGIFLSMTISCSLSLFFLGINIKLSKSKDIK